MPASQPRMVVLIGMMASGKTTVGRAVAEALGWSYIDNDAAFQARTGLTAAEYARRHGDDAMHAVEHEVLADHLAGEDRVVLAAPGSVADVPGIDLGRALVVWLDADPAVLAERVRSADHRPLLDAEVATVLERLDRQRRQRYAELADLRIDTAVTPPGDAVVQVLAALR